MHKQFFCKIKTQLRFGLEVNCHPEERYNINE